MNEYAIPNHAAGWKVTTWDEVRNLVQKCIVVNQPYVQDFETADWGYIPSDELVKEEQEAVMDYLESCSFMDLRVYYSRPDYSKTNPNDWNELLERFNGEMELEINQKMRSQIHLFCWLVEEKQVVVLYSAPYNFFSNDEEGFEI